MARISDYSQLMRTGQWYKNLILLVPFFLIDGAREGWPIVAAIFGFCCISSVTYIINDWLDRKKDRLHPTKKERPLAAGRISGAQAEFVAGILLLITVCIGWQLGAFYLWVTGIYFLSTNLYSFGLKRIPFVDISLIAGNFMLRMLGGMIALPLLFDMKPFVLVALLMFIFLSHKRRSDMKLMGKSKAVAHKAVLKYYRRPVVYALRGIAYLGILWMLWGMGLVWWDIAALLSILLKTSHEFVNDAKIVMKPHHLMMQPHWILTVVVALAVLLLV